MLAVNLSPLFCAIRVMGRIQFLSEIQFFSEIGFVKKIK